LLLHELPTRCTINVRRVYCIAHPTGRFCLPALRTHAARLMHARRMRVRCPLGRASRRHRIRLPALALRALAV